MSAAKQIVPDKIFFQMPKDPELIWPSVSMLQQYVNGYDQRMANCDVSGGHIVYQLHYGHDLPEDIWNIFQQLELKLTYQPEPIDNPDMLIDFSDERLLQFQNSGKHCCQIAGVLCGEEGKPMPLIKKVKPGLNGTWVRIFSGEHEDGYLSFPLRLDEKMFKDDNCIGVTQNYFLHIKDGEVAGVLGYADFETYMAASMGLPVIEIVPADRPKTWLSKFGNPGYRMVRGTGGVQQQIENAKASIERWLKYCQDKEKESWQSGADLVTIEQE